MAASHPAVMGSPMNSNGNELMKKTLFLTTALIFSGHMAISATVAEQVVEKLKADGFENIEVAQRGETVKVEGVRQDLKVEAVYDTTTGEKLKEAIGRPGDEDKISDDDGNDDGNKVSEDDGTDDGEVILDDDGTDDQGKTNDDGHDDDGGDDNGDDHGGDGGDHGGDHGGDGGGDD